jgi:hypothetical protein
MNSADKESETTANRSSDARDEKVSARSLAEFVGQAEAISRNRPSDPDLPESLKSFSECDLESVSRPGLEPGTL